MKLFIPHTIRIHIPNARQVAVIGDFNNWHSNAHPLVQVGPDLWERIVDLPAGRQRYAFFVLEEPAASSGTLRSRIVANGSVLNVPADPQYSVSIAGHPALTLRYAEPLQDVA